MKYNVEKIKINNNILHYSNLTSNGEVSYSFANFIINKFDISNLHDNVKINLLNSLLKNNYGVNKYVKIMIDKFSDSFNYHNCGSKYNIAYYLTEYNNHLQLRGFIDSQQQNIYKCIDLH